MLDELILTGASAEEGSSSIARERDVVERYDISA